MSIRIFHCRCNHKLRFGTSTCSYCFRPTPIYNRWWLPPLAVALVALFVFVSVANGAFGAPGDYTRLQAVPSLG
ncbi:hypothetical protein [Antarctobacter jejuensis]|uniref:hypothetical protein n=1 Tax=Antarctobacter jejuensis TaxID=1439938 RepID=UPI003FD0F83C